MSLRTATTPTSLVKVNASWSPSRRATRAGRVVRGVDEDGGAAPHDLEASGRRGRGEAGAQHLDVELLLTAADERLDRGDGHGDVLRHVRAVEGQEEVGIGRGEPAHGDGLATDGDVAALEAELLALVGDLGADLLGALVEDGDDGRVVLPGAHGDGLGLDDPGLLERDVALGVAEEVLVVEGDRRDDRDDAVGDVGGVPAAAHADLDDGDVDGGVGERGVGDGDEHLEVGHPRLALGDGLRRRRGR